MVLYREREGQGGDSHVSGKVEGDAGLVAFFAPSIKKVMKIHACAFLDGDY